MSWPILKPGGEMLPGIVTSNLQAARTNFVTPAVAVATHTNPSSTKSVQGGSLIITGIHYHLVADAATEGFTINQIHGTGPTTTPMFSVSLPAAGVVTASKKLWIPCVSPTISAGAAVQGGRLALALIGTPTVGSWLILEVLHHHDVHYNARWSLGTDIAF